MQWRLFDGLQDIHYIRAARKNLESAKHNHLDVQRVLMEQVSAAFIQAEIAKEQMRIAKSNCEFNQKLESEARIRYEVGKIPEADVLNFSLALVRAESDFLKARKDFEQACSVIALLLAIDGGQLDVNQYPKLRSPIPSWKCPTIKVVFQKRWLNVQMFRPRLLRLQCMSIKWML